MPELPEVETMVRGLRPVMEGHTLRSLQVLDPQILDGCAADELAESVRGARVQAVERRGKWVVLSLARHAGLIVIQPRMTGGFWLVRPERPDHVRMLFRIIGRRQPVWFCDTRRLGRVSWHATREAAEQAFARSHGPDALEIGLAVLTTRLKPTARAIKPAIMDQKVVAGIGNIYADEILFQAKLHPSRVARALDRSELGRLHRAIGTILNAAIAAEGSSFDAGYRTVLGREGGFLSNNAVYGREGEACLDCRAPILRRRIPGLIGRSTYFCSVCQPEIDPGNKRPRRSRRLEQE